MAMALAMERWTWSTLKSEWGTEGGTEGGAEGGMVEGSNMPCLWRTGGGDDVPAGAVAGVAVVLEVGVESGVDQGELVASLGEVAAAGAGDLEDAMVGVGRLGVLLGEGRGTVVVGGGRGGGVQRGVGTTRRGVASPRAEVRLRWVVEGRGGVGAT
jgi:hypothetical protein